MIAKELHVGRDTIRKGTKELASQVPIIDNHHAKGRKKVENKLPYLLEDIKSIVDSQSQTDPNFKTTRLFTRLTIREIRKQLILQKGYEDTQLPTNQTLLNKTNELGYKLTKVRKIKPLKKIEETDMIFEKIQEVRKEYQEKANVVILLIDAKDKVKIGEFSRGGKSRSVVRAIDHDFSAKQVTPFGILDMSKDQVEITLTESKVTADFIVDTIQNYWCMHYAGTKDTLIIHSDNGSENNSHRTEFIKRVVEFAVEFDVKVLLSYYPPYHSKYNPIERVWGILEQHWNGALLDNLETVEKFIQSMTWKGKPSFVNLTDKTYEVGVKVGKEEMKQYESVLERGNGIEKWFVKIEPKKCKKILKIKQSE